LFIKKLKNTPTIIETVILAFISGNKPLLTKRYIPSVFRKMLETHTIMYLVACFLIFPFVFSNTHFLLYQKASNPPETAPVTAAVTYQTPSNFVNTTKTVKSNKVAKMAIKLYFINASNEKFQISPESFRD